VFILFFIVVYYAQDNQETIEESNVEIQGSIVEKCNQEH
jgi:hypothetical protein